MYTTSETLPRPGTVYPNHKLSTDQLVKREADASQGVESKSGSRKRMWIYLGVAALILVATGTTIGALLVTKVIGSGSTGSATGTGGSDSASELDGEDQECTNAEDIPSEAEGTDLDVTSWLDTTGFNCTYTDETVGDLPVVGLMTSWDDSARANPNVPPLDESWGSYLDRPARGVNVGGWFSLEPFITPSLFEGTDAVDEWTLCEHLGDDAAAILEEHYATYITEADFEAIADAGLDHVRIPFSYWAVTTYDEDPYVPRISWRYLLRSIEWARQYGLRVKLDLHGLPGSQNGWNHSGRLGLVDFLEGENGETNAERTLEIHDRLSQFFAQDRYQNVIVFYGLANEPSMDIDQTTLVEWTAEAYDIVRDNGISTAQVFSESMRGLEAWTGQLTGYGDSLVVDAHQYTIFGDLLSLDHQSKIEFACENFMEQSVDSISDGFGPTMIGEWSQADTDCVEHLNGVGNGARWEGEFEDGDPMCPTGDDQCSCDRANADPSDYSDDYKEFLLMFAIAQMDAFEAAWGWFYWTWKAETAAQWSYKHGLEYGYMPEKAYDRDWSCSDDIPSFESLE